MGDDGRADDSTESSADVFHDLSDAVFLHVVSSPDPNVVDRTVSLSSGSLDIGRSTDGGQTPGRRRGRFDVRDSRASRQHARIRRDPASGLLLEDLGSKNGTRLNGALLDRAPVVRGDVIRTGDTLFVLCPVLHLSTPLPGHPGADILGISWGVGELRTAIRKVAATELSVLLLGESGTGKELVARALHEGSRRAGPFRAINTAAIPGDLFEAELFGATRGAFSGAHADRKGWIREAEGGTLFLDEIGDLPPTLQSKLLRTLETHEVTPVGTATSIRVNVRFVAATNRPLETDAGTERFRLDLLHRLNEFTIRLPPLRERREDIPLLWSHFSQLAAPPAPSDAADVMEALLCYPWPGNVRELRNAASRFAVQARTEVGLHWSVEHLPIPVLDHYRQSRQGGPCPPSVGRASATVSQPRPADGAAEGSELALRRGRRPDRETLLAAIRRHEGNLAAVARDFGRHRPQVYRWMRIHGIDLEEVFESDPP